MGHGQYSPFFSYGALLFLFEQMAPSAAFSISWTHHFGTATFDTRENNTKKEDYLSAQSMKPILQSNIILYKLCQYYTVNAIFFLCYHKTL